MAELASRIYNNLTPVIILIAGVCLAGLLCTHIILRASKFHPWRKLLLAPVALIYVAGLLYVTLLSREPGSATTVIVKDLTGYRDSFEFDLGFIGFLRLLKNKQIGAGLDTVHVSSIVSLEEIILNILLFVPFGYLMPTIFKHARLIAVTSVWGFVVSLGIETTQLFTGLGIFDIDDLINNTLGTVCGYILFTFFLRPFLRTRKQQKQVKQATEEAPQPVQKPKRERPPVREADGEKIAESYMQHVLDSATENH